MSSIHTTLPGIHGTVSPDEHGSIQQPVSQHGDKVAPDAVRHSKFTRILLNPHDRFIIKHFVLPDKRKADPRLPGRVAKGEEKKVLAMEYRYAPTLGRRVVWNIPATDDIDMDEVQKVLKSHKDLIRSVKKEEEERKKASAREEKTRARQAAQNARMVSR